MEDYPQRPPRIHLFKRVTPFYFVTFNTYKKRNFLATSELHKTFISFCQRARQEHNVEVGRYVIMPDHIHLFIRLDPEKRLASWIQSLRSVLGKTLIAKGINKPHWQEGFFDHVMRSSESYGEKWQYIQENPVRAGLCETVQSWPYQGEINRLSY